MMAPTGQIKSMQAVSVHLFKQADGAGSKVQLAGPDLALVQVAQHKGNDSPALHRVLNQTYSARQFSSHWDHREGVLLVVIRNPFTFNLKPRAHAVAKPFCVP